ncbi:Hybrid signal transduction histidine kinase K [Lachnellula occidentalis]|uniref:Hybrid signal transduction histidine kinase K n=1 Tax=Lachnellula occidentalis TaxID=215460 RepID=A0A8H8S0P1_9HELO|nr:Hybrid signal transduction histidine kinase K [Lachnellula occidentalis]
MASPARKTQKVSEALSDSPTKRTRSRSAHEELGRQGVTRRNSHTAFENTAGKTLDNDFAVIGIGGLLEQDPRPTFVLNLDTNANDIFAPDFVNKAFQSYPQLKDVLPFKTTLGSPLSPKLPSADFRQWIQDLAHHHESPPSTPFEYCGFAWIGFKIQSRWLIISGQETYEGSASDGRSLRPIDGSTTPQRNASTAGDPPLRLKNIRTISEDSILSDDPPPLPFVTPGTPDWTLTHPVGDLSPHVMLARSVDWSTTSLGDMQTWSSEFRQMANMMMAYPHPAALYWGDELTVLYNKPYADTVAGNKHPRLMGACFPASAAFAEVWEWVRPVFQEVRRTGKAGAMADQMVPIERHGFLEEAFFTWSLTPIYGGTSEILGLYNAPFETTRQTRAARATQTLIRLGQQTALAQKVSEFWPNILKALEDSEFDFPFALIYSVVDDIDFDDEASISSESSQAMKSCILESALGVPEGHPAAPTRLDLKHARGGFIPSFRDAMKTRLPKLLSLYDGSLSESLMEGIEWRGYGDPCKEAVVCPIRPTNGENVMGFLVIGLNPRRKFDLDYQAFIRLLDRQLATSLASVTLFEGEIKRGLNAAEAAASERSRLSEELAVQRSRLQRIAEISSVGMHSLAPDGTLLEANDRWYEMTGHTREPNGPMSFTELFHDDSLEEVDKAWKRLTEDKVPYSSELKLKRPWYDPATGEKHDYWILAASQPEFSRDNTLKSIMGSITDITPQKLSIKDADERARLSHQLLISTQQAKDLQNKRLEEVEETRRAQNSFIDITSHEMRNPLSAVLQCADGISTSLNELLAEKANLDPKLISTIEGAIESAETIQLCAQHQKSIVDDILTISKLDSDLLLITPDPVQPVQVVQQALKMFVTECQMAKIKMGFHVDDTWRELGVNTVMLDSSRLLQVLINLMTNAIKFTKSEERTRTIDVSLAAYTIPPIERPPHFLYFPTKKGRSDVTASDDFGKGKILYLRFEVRDSGCGLGKDEKKNLFERFSQASPRTHVKYGGSGLGLFISRQLTELQGGEIGVASEAGVGSTFAFYVKARKVETLESPPKTGRINVGQQAASRVATDLTQMVRDRGSAAKLSHPSQSAPHGLSSAGPPAASLPRPNLSSWHVLIVEDNLVNQRILAQQIRKLGCQIHVANHGGEALELIRTTKYFKGQEDLGKELSVILMDLEMPVMDGLTCVRKIRAMEVEGLVKKHLPIIAVTANARGEQIAAARDSGMDDVMPKPFRIGQLVPKIVALLLGEAEPQ